MRKLNINKIVFFLLALVFTISGMQGVSLALSNADLKSLNYDTVWYQPDNGSSFGSGCTPDLTSSVNEDNVWNFLRQLLTPNQAAGIMGNLKVEAHFETRLVEYGWPNSRGEISEAGKPSSLDENIPPPVGPQGQPGYGIAQWTSPGRKQGLANKAVALGNKSPSDIVVQISFLWDELTGSYSGVYNTITSTDDIAIIAREFGHGYEGYGTDSETARLEAARGILIKYGSTTPSPGQIVGCSDSGDPNFNLIKLPSPMATPGGQITPKGITLHWWGGGSNGRGIDALVDALRGNSSCGSSGCSVQIGITADGKVYQMTQNLTDLTYHATGGNQTTFGIEIEGGPSDFGANGPTTNPAKFNAVVATVKYLVNKYSLPLDGAVVCGDVSGVHPHKAYNSCPAALSKTDIDDSYFNAVMQKVRE